MTKKAKARTKKQLIDVVVEHVEDFDLDTLIGYVKDIELARCKRMSMKDLKEEVENIEENTFQRAVEG